MSDRLQIVFALYDGLTQLDFTGPHQVLCRLPGAAVTLASATGGRVAAEGGLVFADLARLADVGACDLLCVPGGYGATRAALNPAFVDEVRRLGAKARYVTSVCTGSLILGAAGLLEGRRAACHWLWRDLLPLFGAIPDPGRVVWDGRVITGGGVTAGLDFALSLAAEIAGVEFAQRLQLTLEYAPSPPFDCGRPETAPPEVTAAVRSAAQPLLDARRSDVEAAARALHARRAAGAEP